MGRKEEALCFGFLLLVRILLFFLFCFLPGKLVDELFNYLFFDIHVKAQQADKGEEL